MKAEKNVKVRILTEITNENAAEIIKIMPSAEIRHLDNIRSNFVVADGKHYPGYALSNMVHLHGISTNTFAIVEAHQFLFEFLWNASIPAKFRIALLREIFQRRRLRFFMDQRISLSIFYTTSIMSANDWIVALILPAHRCL